MEVRVAHAEQTLVEHSHDVMALEYYVLLVLELHTSFPEVVMPPSLGYQKVVRTV